MDYGIEGRTALVAGGDSALAQACCDRLRIEGVQLAGDTWHGLDDSSVDADRLVDEPVDIVVFILASVPAAYLSGVVITVDGGASTVVF